MFGEVPRGGTYHITVRELGYRLSGTGPLTVTVKDT